MSSIVDTTNDSILHSLIIQFYISILWNKAKYLILGQAFLFISFCALITIHVFVMYSLFDFTSTLINALYLVYELIEMIMLPKEYFADILNWFDLGRIGVAQIYFTILWTGMEVGEEFTRT
jgi:hypothetical protein